MARQLPRRLLAAELAGQPPRLSPPGNEPEPEAPPPDQQQLVEWMARLHLLIGVPFNYLVPDEAMLPTQSARFFRVDSGWIEALLDGAWSLGFAGVTQAVSLAGRSPMIAAAAARARELRTELLADGASGPGAAPADDQHASVATGTATQMSGFLLRSSAVAGWPGMEASAYADAAGAEPLELLRMERLTPSLLLCLFGGVLARVDLREPFEALHFALTAEGSGWSKGLRYANAGGGHTVGDAVGGPPLQVPMRESGAKRVVDLAGLAGAMEAKVWATSPHPPISSAEMALEMNSGASTVTFLLPGRT